MDSRAALRSSMELADMVLDRYLSDLEDSELLIRTVEGANHTAWQLGHLISAENQLMSAIRPGCMPELPAGFNETYTKETAGSDDPDKYLSKDEYLRLLKEQRQGTFQLLESLSDEDLDAPAPERMRERFPTVGSMMSLQAIHTMMHAGQWSVLRRKLGKPVVI